MKAQLCFIVLMSIISYSVSKQHVQSIKKLKIIKTDTFPEFYVFKTVDDSNREVIVLAEMDKVNECKPFKRFIIEDSIHATSKIKAGTRYDFVGFYVSTIDGIKIRNEGELVKINWNCNCFTGK